MNLRKNLHFLASRLNNPDYKSTGPVTSVGDLYRLFTQFNNKHFDGKLPKIKIVKDRSQQNAGSLQTKYVNGKPEFVMTISEEIMDDPRKVVDTVLHEMIHLEHSLHDYQRALKGEDPGPQLHGGHDSYFNQRLRELKDKGYNVNEVLNEADYLFDDESQKS